MISTVEERHLNLPGVNLPDIAFAATLAGETTLQLAQQLHLVMPYKTAGFVGDVLFWKMHALSALSEFDVISKNATT